MLILFNKPLTHQCARSVNQSQDFLRLERQLLFFPVSLHVISAKDYVTFVEVKENIGEKKYHKMMRAKAIKEVAGEYVPRDAIFAVV